MKIKTKAYNSIQTVLRFLYDRVNEQHEDCAHAIKLRSSDITGMSMDSIVDAVRYLEQLEYIEFTTKSYYSEKYHEVKNQQLKLEEKMGKSIFNQNSCMSMAIRYFTDDGKLLQSLKQELEQLKHGAELEILVTPTKKFQDGCRSFGITGKGAIVYQFSYDEKTREVTINKQVFHRCSLNSTPDEFLTATMKVRKYAILLFGMPLSVNRIKYSTILNSTRYYQDYSLLHCLKMVKLLLLGNMLRNMILLMKK